MQRRESKQLPFRSNIKLRSIKEPTNQPEILVDAPQSSNQSENQLVIESLVQSLFLLNTGLPTKLRNLHRQFR